MTGEDELFQMELNLHPNEASGLLMIENEELLGEHGWGLGFWACLDEGEIEDCVAAIGHHRGYPHEEGCDIERLRAEASGASGPSRPSLSASSQAYRASMACPLHQKAAPTNVTDEGVHLRLTLLLVG